jgi:hypothetical protein
LGEQASASDIATAAAALLGSFVHSGTKQQEGIALQSTPSALSLVSQFKQKEAYKNVCCVYVFCFCHDQNCSADAILFLIAKPK